MIALSQIICIVSAVVYNFPPSQTASAVPELTANCRSPLTQEYCYSLYGSDNRQQASIGLTWAEASRRCRADEKQLAIVDTPEVQQTVADLVSIIDSDLNQVWLAGRRRFEQRAWSYLNNSPFTGHVNEFYSNNCVKLYIDKHQLFEYREIRCTDNSNVYALCQYGSTPSECQGFYHTGHCYFKSPTFVSWFDGMTYCHLQTNGTGTLAYIDLEEDTVRRYLNELRNESYSLELLVGIRKQPWIWVSATVNKSVVYSNWISGTGDYNGDRCITIVANDNKQWKDVPCDEQWYYFLCQNGSRPETTTTTTTTTTLATTTVLSKTTTVRGALPVNTMAPNPGQAAAGTNHSGHNKPTIPFMGTTPISGQRSASSSTEKNGKKLKTEHIIAIIVGIVAVAAIIGGVFAIQRCPSKNDESQIAYVKEVKNTTAMHQMTPEVTIQDESKQNGAIPENGIKKENPLTTKTTTPSDVDNGSSSSSSSSSSSTTTIKTTTTTNDQPNHDEVLLSDENETRGVGEDETRGVDEDETRGVDEDETREVDEDETRGVDEDKTRGVDENALYVEVNEVVSQENGQTARDNEIGDKNELDESIEDTAIWVAL